MKPGDASRFYDPESGGEAQIRLIREGTGFRMLRRFGYRDPAHKKPFIVPKLLSAFHTDLASIPRLFAWLVPGQGTHLPAVLLHDALTLKKDEDPTYGGGDHPVDREEADRILRDAMASLGVPIVRRWIMWTGVIIASALTTFRPRWYWIPVIVLSLAGIAALGVLATLDALDIVDVLPWMGDHWWLREVVLGGVFAVVIPFAVSVAWRRIWQAGAIAGIGLAFLLHVTATIAVVFGLYLLLELLVSKPKEGSSPNWKKNVEASPRQA